MSVINHNDDPFDQNHGINFLNVDNLEVEINDSSFSGAASNSSNEYNDNTFKYRKSVINDSSESAPSKWEISHFENENSSDDEVFGNERDKFLDNSNDISKTIENKYVGLYSSQNVNSDPLYIFSNQEKYSSSRNYRIVKSNSLVCPSTYKSETKRVSHSAATSPYPCRSIHKKNTADIPSMELPNPPQNPFIMDNLMDDDDNDDTIYSNNQSTSFNSVPDFNDSIQLIREPLSPPLLHHHHCIQQQRVQIHQQQQLQREPPPYVNNQFSIRNEEVSVCHYYQHILPRGNNNNNVNSNNYSRISITVVGCGSCRCESGRCSNGNCGCLKNGLECSNECFCRLKGMTCENGKEKRERKLSQPKPVKCSCTKSGCNKGKCTCKKNNLACGRDCSCACNLRKIYI